MHVLPAAALLRMARLPRCCGISEADNGCDARTGAGAGNAGGAAVPVQSLGPSARVVYVSHTWLRSLASPPHADDEGGVKRAAILLGLERIAAARKCLLGELFVWIDYRCVRVDRLQVCSCGSTTGVFVWIGNRCVRVDRLLVCSCGSATGVFVWIDYRC
jgi:hypothetical protein